MLRPRRNWTRGVAAQHASLSRWRSPVRIRSGPPSLRISLRPVRPPGRGVPLVRNVLAADSDVLCQTPAGETASHPDRRSPHGRGRPGRRGHRCADRIELGGAGGLGRPDIGGRRPDASPGRDARLDRRRRADARYRRPCPADARPRPRRRSPAGPDRGRPDRAGHQLPGDADRDRPQGGQGRPGRDQRPLHGRRARRHGGRRDPRRASASIARPTRPAWSWPGTARPSRRTSPRTGSASRSCAPTPSGRRFARSPGASKALFGVDRVQAAGGLAADRPPARPDRRRTPTTRRPPGPCSRAATSCSTAACTRPSRSRARARTSRSMAGRPRSPAAARTARRSAGTRRTRSGPATPALSGRSSRAPTSPSPTSRTRRPNKWSWHTSKTVFSANPAFIDGLANAGIDYVSLANNHIRDAGGAGLLQTITNVTKRGIAVSGAGKNLAAARKPADPGGGRDEGRDPRLRRHRRRAITRRRRRSAARRSTAQDRQGGRGRRPQGRRRPRHRLPALGHRVRPDPVRQPEEAGADDHRLPAPTWSSATTPTGRPRWSSTRASRSGTRSATSCSTRPGRSRRWRGSPSS